jgi:hypothetical protein
MIGAPPTVDPAVKPESRELLIAVASDEESGDAEPSTAVEPCLHDLQNSLLKLKFFLTLLHLPHMNNETL